MILTLFNWLYGTLYASATFALMGSFIWGILSILLSPCHLASIPLIIGFIDDQGRISTKRAFLLSFLFAFGILITITGIGIITGMLGRMMGDIGNWSNYFVAVIFILVGFHLLEIITLPFIGKSGQVAYREKGLFAAFILGLVFGVALGPCTFAYMAPILGVSFSVASTNIVFSIALIVAYALGHISVIVIAGTFTEIVQKYLNWSERSKGAVVLKKICGILVLFGGLYLFIK
ncbi:MAG: cytochrome c biogenesis protein CcdA [Endomicrobiales bacterium]|nr:cytochrome c biogenesis protein CcdA [Endomicrobiales bacterium]